MAKKSKAKPVRVYSRKTDFHGTFDRINNILIDLDNPDEGLILDRLQASFDEAKLNPKTKSNTVIGSILSNAVPGVEIKSASEAAIVGVIHDANTYPGAEMSFGPEYHLRNVLRRIRQGKLKVQ